MSAQARLVHVVDDDIAVRDALRWLLEGERYSVETHASAEQFLARCSSRQPACAVVDIRMPGMSGLELQERLSRQGWRLPIVFLTAHGDVPLAVMAMRRGAVDFVEKPFADEHLLDAVRRALSVHAQHVGAAEEERAVVHARARKLSSRERDVLAAVVSGKSSKTIAAALQIAPKTVEAHRARIMAKLGAPSLAALVRIVVRHGLLETPAS